LAIHANLISENVPRFDPGDNSSDAVPSILTPRPKLEESTLVLFLFFFFFGSCQRCKSSHLDLYEIENILSDLFDKLCEMLLYMVHTLVIEPAVWQTAFNCFLFFVANHGAVDLEKYSQDRRFLFLKRDCATGFDWSTLVYSLLSSDTVVSLILSEAKWWP